jgi:hypothetical protein
LQENANREQRQKQFDEEMAYRREALDSTKSNRDQAMEMKALQMQILQGNLDAKIQHYNDLRDFYGSTGAVKQQNADTNSRNADTRARAVDALQQNADTNTGKLGLSQQRFDLSTPDGVVNHVANNLMPAYNSDITLLKNNLKDLAAKGEGDSDQAHMLSNILAVKQNAYQQMAENPVGWYSSNLQQLHPAASKKGLDPNMDTVETETVDSTNPTQTVIKKTKSLVPKLSPAPAPNSFVTPEMQQQFSMPSDAPDSSVDFSPLNTPDVGQATREKPAYFQKYLGNFHQGGVNGK